MTIRSCSDDETILRGGKVMKVALIEKLLDLEFRGVRFTAEAGTVRVSPASLLSANDLRWLDAHREQVKEAIAYVDRVVAEDAARDRLIARSLPA